MSFESFYGGRQGASFVIVRRFDGIDIPQPDANGNYTYTGGYYAVDSNQNLILSGGAPIEQNSYNQREYSWEYFQMCSDIAIPVSGGGTYNFTDKLAEGMVQCFEQGAVSSSEVNYGEYVIIDTIVNMHNKNNVDNGKVFRRGMDYQGELAGAEYIGQIVGPQGETPEVDITHYLDVIALTPHKQDTYNPVEQDIIPGSYVDGSGVRHFEDEIKFAYATIKDPAGNVIGCQIGFQIPTLVQEFEARSMSPYEQRAVGVDGKYYNYDLITEDADEYIDGKWKHPFYEKWQIKLPHGYHGINSTNIEIVPTATIPEYHTNKVDFAGARVYSNPGLTNLLATTSASLPVLRDADYDADDSVPYAIVMYGGQRCYVRKEECFQYVVRYRETNFDNIEEGEVTYYEIGDYENIKDITIDQDGRVHVYYDSLDSFGNYKKTDQPNRLEWIDYITIEEDGMVNFYYNTDHDNPAFSSTLENRLKYIKKITFNSADASGIEGSGDQKFVVTYNTKDLLGNNEVEDNSGWAAMNYIIEAKISTPTVDYPHAPFCHLIVIYSDPAYRAARSGSWVTYPSDKLGIEYTEWVDLGNVRGEKGGLHSITDVDNVNKLYDDSGSHVAIPPEYLLTAIRTRQGGSSYIWQDGVDADYMYAGWGATVKDISTGIETIYFYDYANKQWYAVGTIDSSLISPESIIMKSSPQVDMTPAPTDDTLHDNGFWLAAETAIYVI